MKRWISLGVTLMMLTLTSIAAFAAGTANITVAVTPNTNLKQGDTVTVTVTMDPVKDLSGLQFDLVYDENKVELVKGSSDISGLPKSMMTIQNPDVPGGIRVIAVSGNDLQLNSNTLMLKAQFKVKTSNGSIQFDLDEEEFIFSMENGQVTGTLSSAASVGTNTQAQTTAPKASPFKETNKTQGIIKNGLSKASIYIPPELQAQMDKEETSKPEPVFIPGVTNPDGTVVQPNQSSSASSATTPTTTLSSSSAPASSTSSTTSTTSSAASATSSQPQSSQAATPQSSENGWDGTAAVSGDVTAPSASGATETPPPATSQASGQDRVAENITQSMPQAAAAVTPGQTPANTPAENNEDGFMSMILIIFLVAIVLVVILGVVVLMSMRRRR